MEVKGFNNNELNEAFRNTPKIVCDYISALKRAYDMSEETNKKAVAKIKELSKAIDVFYSSERKTIVDLNESNKKFRSEARILKLELKELISLCENAGDFSNGNMASGMDEGSVNAGIVVANARNALYILELKTKEENL